MSFVSRSLHPARFSASLHDLKAQLPHPCYRTPSESSLVDSIRLKGNISHDLPRLSRTPSSTLGRSSYFSHSLQDCALFQALAEQSILVEDILFPRDLHVHSLQQKFDIMGSYTQSSWPPSWAYSSEVNDPYSGYSQYPSYSSYLAESMDAYQTHHHHLVHHHQMSRTTESKPRLSKEEVEVLEAEFQKNHKPNSSTKKALAESMRVDNARINVGVHDQCLVSTFPLTLRVELVPEQESQGKEGEKHSRVRSEAKGREGQEWGLRLASDSA